MKLNLYKLTPPGTDIPKYKNKLRLALYICIAVSQTYWFRYFQCRSWLFVNGKLVAGRTMEPFWEVFSVNGSYPYVLPYAAAVLMMLWWMLTFYRSFYQDSKSIFLMKRLPDRWELARRCVTVPLLCMGIFIALLLVHIAVFYVGYLLFTPKSTLVG